METAFNMAESQIYKKPIPYPKQTLLVLIVITTGRNLTGNLFEKTTGSGTDRTVIGGNFRHAVEKSACEKESIPCARTKYDVSERCDQTVCKNEQQIDYPSRVADVVLICNCLPLGAVAMAIFVYVVAFMCYQKDCENVEKCLRSDRIFCIFYIGTGSMLLGCMTVYATEVGPSVGLRYEDLTPAFLIFFVLTALSTAGCWIFLMSVSVDAEKDKTPGVINPDVVVEAGTKKFDPTTNLLTARQPRMLVQTTPNSGSSHWKQPTPAHWLTEQDKLYTHTL